MVNYNDEYQDANLIVLINFESAFLDKVFKDSGNVFALV